MKKTYRTKGREKLLAFLAENPDRLFTAEELFLTLQGTPAAARSSLYRLLSRLCEEGSVQKLQSPDLDCAVYQYVGEHCDCKTHFHEKCTLCGKIEHLDCADSAHFAEHLLREHGFVINCGQSILYGICADCQAQRAGGV